MKNPKLLLLAISCLLFNSCNSTTEKVTAAPAKKELKDSVPAKEDNSYEAARAKDWCVTGEPVPIIKKNIFPGSTFSLSKDKGIGTETVTLPNGDKLVITITGCEYYILIFRFETARFTEPITNTAFWYGKAIAFLSETEHGFDTNISIPDGYKALKEYSIKNKDSLSYAKDDIDFMTPEEAASEDYMGSFIKIENVEKLPDNKTALTVTLWKGPL
jgi:hypothetical protein